uniref:Fibronectin type-III domain-containing protein n=1 Tax=Rhabditophanes sp. KR3021 TaxID=114890 RepID=A0AC35TQ54_9BILA
MDFTSKESPSFTISVPLHHTQIAHDFSDHDTCMTGPIISSASNTLARGFSMSNYKDNTNSAFRHDLNNPANCQAPSGTYILPNYEQQLQNNLSASLSNLAISGNTFDYGSLTKQGMLATDPPLPDTICPYPPHDVSRITVQEIKQPNQPRLPFPREITIERQMAQSAFISWQAPSDHAASVLQYHVCVDGTVRTIVPPTYECKALIEGLNLEKSTNISVRAITDAGHSMDAACTMTIGNEATVAVQHLRVYNLTPISCCVSWYPSNSNAEHILLLNGIKVGACPSAVFQVQLHGLLPATIYRVSVRTKHPKAVLEQRPVERCLDFKTLPKIGLPDPPSKVALELGPQPGYILLSWTPVTNQPKPPSRAAVHSYLVYADGKNIAEVITPNADHILLNIGEFQDGIPIHITVRTRTKEGAVSADSNIIRVPRNIGNLTQSQHQQLLASTLNLGGSVPYLEPSQYNYTGGTHPIIDTSTYQNLANQAALLSTTSLPTSLIQHQAPGTGTLLRFTEPTTPANIHQPSHQLYTSYPGTAPPLYSQDMTTLNQQQYPSLIHNHSHNLGAAGRSQSSGLLTTMTPGIQQPILPQSYYQTTTNGPPPSARQRVLKHQNTAPLNYFANTLTKGGALSGGSHLQTEYPSSSTQYYTFHPDGLYKEVAGPDEKPSVLEMENNYLLKHQSQQIRNVGSKFYYPDTRSKVDYYARNDGVGIPYTSNYGYGTIDRKVVAGGIRGPQNSQLARVRSEEQLGGTTRSEPDLRPTVMAGNPIEEEDIFPGTAFPTERNCRWFVALYDFNHHMSPNPNAVNEELSFKKHQLIKVYGEADGDGFYHGQINRRCGLVPGNMVIEIAKSDIFSDGRGVQQAVLPDPSVRRMRWGSIKSRSYDHAGDRRRAGASLPPISRSHIGNEDYYGSSLERAGAPLQKRSLNEEVYGRRYYDGRVPPTEEVPYQAGYRYGTGTSQRPQQPPPHFGQGGRDYSSEFRRDGAVYDRSMDVRQSRPDYSGRRGRGSASYDKYEYDRELDSYEDSFGPKNAPPPQQQIIGRGRYDDRGSKHSMDQQQMPYSEDGRYGAKFGSKFDKVKRMYAKFDYDTRHLSPNSDAIQVELSFKQGDIITVMGDVDEDGFYYGELNNVRGLVPSNFLSETMGNALAPPNMGQQKAQEQQQQMIDQGQQPRVKGVAFSESTQMPTMERTISNGSTAPPIGIAGIANAASAARKAAPARQTSQTQVTTKPTTMNGSASAVRSSSKGPPTSSKVPSKKGSESIKNGTSNGGASSRKISQGAKKVETSSKKK